MSAGITRPLESYISEAIQLCESIHNNVHKISELMWEASKNYREFQDEFLKKCSIFPEQVVRNFIAAGAKKKVAELVLESHLPGIKALLSMPFDVQVKYSKEPVLVLTKQGEGLLIDPRVVSSIQAKMAFDKEKGDVRTLAEQRAWIESRKILKGRPTKVNEPWRVVKDGIVIFPGESPFTIPKDQILDALKKMK